jgi:hypothetical protein
MHDHIRDALGLAREKPEDEKPRVPAFSRADDVPNGTPLAPQVRANIRRIDNDPRQLTWDVAQNPEVMLSAVRGNGSVLLPVARFMEATKKALERNTGGNALVSQDTMMLTLHSAARLLHRGDVSGAVMFLMPIRRLLSPNAAKDERGIDMVRTALCDIIRSLYPCAPAGWTVTRIDPTPRPAPLDEHLALPGPEEGAS